MSRGNQSLLTIKIPITAVIITTQSSCHPRGRNKQRFSRGNQISTRGAIGHFQWDVLGSRQEPGTLETRLESKETGYNTKQKDSGPT